MFFPANILSSIDYQFFKPVVPNETSSLYNEGAIDTEIFKCTSFLDVEENFDGDDSDVDPNYKPPEESDQEIQNDETDSEIEELANQIERNLEEPIIHHSDSVREIQRKRNLGMEYVDRNGKLMQKRSMQPLKKCRKKCFEKISTYDQMVIFNDYWALGSYSQRVAFAAGLIQIRDTQTLRKPSGDKKVNIRRFTCDYFLIINTTKHSVCKMCFRSTLGETNKFIRTITNKKVNSPSATFFPDKRGKGKSTNKLPETIIEDIKNHIASFPAYESHYTRRDSAKKYLHADLNLTKMYKLFSENRTSAVSITKYSEIFKSLNLKFKSPKTDTCGTCDLLKAKIDASVGEVQEREKLNQRNHLNMADEAYKAKEHDKITARNEESVMMVTFDLQQCLPTPFLRNSISFYKRQLWTYNLTVHDCASNQPYCYMWNETVAKRGGNDIGSCVYRHLKELPATIRHIVLFSDSCAGQNKNSYVGSMFMTVLQSSDTLELIDHKFLVVGHTHMECDVDHALIERAKKKSGIAIHHPRDWYQFVQTIGTKHSMNVIELKSEDFKDFANVAKNKLMWRKVDTDGHSFSWKTVRWLRYTGDFGVVKFKETLDVNAPFRTLNTLKRGGISSMNDEQLSNCYTAPLPVTTEKKKDLLDLLPFIDSAFHQYYQNIRTTDDLNFHPDLTEEADE